MIRRLTQATLVLVPLLTCAVRVQTHTLESPDAIAKEFVRCFSIAKASVRGRQSATASGVVRTAPGDRPPDPRRS